MTGIRRGLLLDRDGVINVDKGYVGRREDFVFNDGIFPFLRAAQDTGWRLAVVTNQAGIARGFYTVADYEYLTQWMLGAFAREGIAIELVLACFEHVEGKVMPFARDSFWRKPNPGMVLEAIQRLRLDPARSAFIGDKISDMQAAKAGGMGKCLWLTQNSENRYEGAMPVQNFDQAFKALD